MKTTSSFFSLAQRVLTLLACFVLVLGCLSAAQAQTVSIAPATVTLLEGNTGQTTNAQFLVTINRSPSTTIRTRKLTKTI